MVGVYADFVVKQVVLLRSGLSMIKCVCGFEAEDESRFTWNSVDPKDYGTELMFLCWDCTDSLHKQYMAEIADMDSNSLLEIAERATTFIEGAIEKEKEADDCN